MTVDFKYLPEFERRAKNLAKKYKSFVKDYNEFLDSLEENPFQGTSLGMGMYKIRMAIASKGKGKSKTHPSSLTLKGGSTAFPKPFSPQGQGM